MPTNSLSSELSPYLSPLLLPVQVPFVSDMEKDLDNDDISLRPGSNWTHKMKTSNATNGSLDSIERNHRSKHLKTEEQTLVASPPRETFNGVTKPTKPLKPSEKQKRVYQISELLKFRELFKEFPRELEGSNAEYISTTFDPIHYKTPTTKFNTSFGSDSDNWRRRDNKPPLIDTPPNIYVYNGYIPQNARVQHKTRTPLISRDPKSKTLAEIKGLLNKLTIRTFSQLSETLVNIVDYEVTTNSSNILIDVINLIWEKAIFESNFCPMYAVLCQKLAIRCQPADGSVDVRKIMVNKVKTKFLSSLKSVPKEELYEDLQPDDQLEAQNKARKKRLGNAQLIGELFKLRMLAETVIHTIIYHLVRGVSVKKMNLEENIPILCTLLITAGLEMDSPEASGYMDQYFARMGVMSGDEALPPRLRFMLKDVIDIRSNSWVPRNPTQLPVATREIQAKVQEEKRQLEILKSKLFKVGDKPNMTNIRPSSLSTRTPTRPAGPNYTVPFRQPNPLPKTLKSSPQYPDHSTNQSFALHPASSPQNFPPLSSSASPMTSGTPTDTISSEDLNKDEVLSTEREEEIESPVIDQHDLSPERESEREESAPVDMDDEEFDNVVTLILREYLSSRELVDAISSFKEISNETRGAIVVERGIGVGLEQKESEAVLLFELLCELWNEQILTNEHFTKGLENTLEILGDIEVDVPFAPKLLGEFLLICLKENIFNLETIKETVISLTKPSQSEKILAKMITNP